MSCATCHRPAYDNLTVTACYHLFHGSCLEDWLNQHTTCPLCTRNISNLTHVPFDNLLRIFAERVQDNPQILEENDICAICVSSFPPLYFQGAQFVHEQCRKPNEHYQPITPTRIIALGRNETGPDYRLPAVASIFIISFCALVHNQANKNLATGVVSIPAWLCVKTVGLFFTVLKKALTQ
jgi:hypothetical protein